MNLSSLVSNSYGGLMNIKVLDLYVEDSTFSNSLAVMGSFLYVYSLGSTLNIDIKRSLFSNGFTLDNGGAIYINSIGS